MTHNEKVDYLISLVLNDSVILAEFFYFNQAKIIRENLKKCNTKDDIIKYYGTLV